MTIKDKHGGSGVTYFPTLSALTIQEMIDQQIAYFNACGVYCSGQVNDESWLYFDIGLAATVMYSLAKTGLQYAGIRIGRHITSPRVGMKNDLYHNFPSSFDNAILNSRGVYTPSNNLPHGSFYIQYSLPGAINGR